MMVPRRLFVTLGPRVLPVAAPRRSVATAFVNASSAVQRIPGAASSSDGADASSTPTSSEVEAVHHPSTFPEADSPLDPLTMVRRLEHAGLHSTHAEVLTRCILEAIASLSLAQRSELVSNGELERDRLKLEARYEHAKAELSSGLKGHEVHVERELQRLAEIIRRQESELKHEKEKSRADLRYEIDKISANARLDINLEKGRMKEQQEANNAKILENDARLDREIHGLRTQIESAKNDVLRYCVGTVFAITSVLIGFVRLSK